MIYAKKDLFAIKNVPRNERTPATNERKFPPATIEWKGEMLHYLGISNKTDLLDKNAFFGEDDVEDAFQNGMVKQFLYANISAEMFEVLLMQNQINEIVIIAIRTRRKA